MYPIKIRDTIIGEGMPKIIVPIVANANRDLIQEIKAVIELEPDMIEWRVDTYEDVENMGAVQVMLLKMREVIGDTPLLFTFRSHKEGGERQVSGSYYEDLIEMAIQSNVVDLVDIELFTEESILNPLILAAQDLGVCVLMSNHDFTKTPPKEEIVSRLSRMQELGADILKIAVMPNNVEDVITLLDATNTIKTKYADRPIITVSMSRDGVISRLSGEIFGSAATFASGQESSAPGQINVLELRTVLEIIHKHSK